jgi:hypothetical protein
MNFVRKSGYSYVDGTIVRQTQSRLYETALDDGRNVVALLDRSTLRRVGCISGDLSGWRVTIAERQSPKSPIIVDLRRVD